MTEHGVGNGEEAGMTEIAGGAADALAGIPALDIRRCAMGDVPVLCAIGAETFRDTFAESNTAEDMASYLRTAYAEPRIRAEVGTPGTRFFIAWIGGTPAGFLKVNFGAAQTEDMGRGVAEIERLYVRRAYKRRGVGTSLMRFALDEARRGGVDGVWLGVWEHNAPARAFYERMGFAYVGSHVFRLGADAQTDLLMRRAV